MKFRMEDILQEEIEAVRNKKNSLRKVDGYISSIDENYTQLKNDIFQELSEDFLHNIPALESKINHVLEIYNHIEEGLLNQPPETPTEDPLTPLDQQFITAEDLDAHYKLFINRIQEQIATIGGGGEVRLKWLDDIVGIATNASAYDGQFLKYDHSIEKFVFATVVGGGGTATQGTQGIQGTAGSAASQGTQGIQGIAGSAGAAGAQGTTGAGTQGTTGAQGATGTQGTNGTQGTTGSFGGATFDYTFNTGITSSVVKNLTSTATSGATTLSVPNITGLISGAPVEGQSIASGTVISSFPSSTSVEISVGITSDIGSGDPVTFVQTGQGQLRLNQTGISTATEMYINDADDNGTDIQSYLRTIDDSTSTIKGHFKVSNKSNADDFALFTISSLSEGTGYFLVNSAFVSGAATSFSASEDVLITFARTGDKGDTGAQGTTGSQGTQGITGAGTQGTTGIQGTQGINGPQGRQGLQGIQGSGGTQGLKGDDGLQGTQGITGAGTQGVQGTQGTQASQGIQGIQGDSIQGSQGTQGDTGTTGSQGTQGIQGSDATVQGIQGTQGTTGGSGAQGTAGAAASQGIQGTQGTQGNTGGQGVQGIQGSDANVQGIQGSEGPQGTTGSIGVQGAAGAIGAQGVQGTSGSNGNQGTQGSGGAIGSQGVQGIQGITGTGTQGTTGSQGTTGTGTQGAAGGTGGQGIQGVQGTLGTQGTDGAAASQGIQGIQGTSGGGGGGGAGYWEQTGVGINTVSNVGIATTNPLTPLQIEDVYGVKTGIGTFNAVVGLSTDLDSFDTSSLNFQTAEYTINVGYGTYIQSQKVLVMQNGTSAYSQEYAVMYNPELVVSIGATMTGTTCKVQATPESGITGLTTYRFVRTTLL